MRSEERRDVASRLRNGGIARNAEEAYTLILSCVGIKPQLPARNTYKDAMARLADLIDPTCEMEVKDGHACCGRFAMATSDERHEAAARLRRMPVGDDLSVHEIARAIGARYDEDRDTSVGVLERLAELIEPGTRAAGTRQGRDGRRGARAQAGRAIAPVPGNNI